eukprot:UN17277
MQKIKSMFLSFYFSHNGIFPLFQNTDHLKLFSTTFVKKLFNLNMIQHASLT